MFAVIYQVPGRSGVGMIQVAGRPLIERQLQWLRAAGCDRVALEIGGHTTSGDLARWVAEQEALGADVSVVLSPRPLGARQVAQRAGFPPGAPFLAIPSDLLGDGDLTLLFRAANGGGAWAITEPPSDLSHALESGTVRLLGPRSEHPRIADGAGWTARIGSVRDAMALGSAALLKKLPPHGGEHVWPVQIHASEIEPGIWVSRGARIDPSAKLIAPVLIGHDAVIRAGARVGPDAFIGERAVIEMGAAVSDATVEPGTIVGEGVELLSCVASPKRVTALDGGQSAPLEDSLLIAPRDQRMYACPAVRLLALVALAIVGPLALFVYLARAALRRPSWRTQLTLGKDGALRLHEGVTGIGFIDAVPRLWDVVRGRRSMVGMVTPPAAADGISAGLLLDAMSAPYGVLNVEPALVPDAGNDLATRLRGRAWYAHAKSLRVDFELVKRLMAEPFRHKGAESRA